ncbi:MAG: hypothetical protein PSV13_15320 [Lacunisphaera sp.]|nr:hypothetical protein [Lacunisphaera sp.]
MNRLALVLLLLLVTGCDTLHGVRRYAASSRLPPVDEVRSTIADVPGVLSVDVKKVEPPRSFGLYQGLKKNPDYYQFLITAADARTVLEMGQEKGKEVMFYSLWMHQPPPREQLEKAVALMDRVYEALRSKYPWLPARGEFTETGRSPVDRK